MKQLKNELIQLNFLKLVEISFYISYKWPPHYSTKKYL
jgi:hypothetical protein